MRSRGFSAKSAQKIVDTVVRVSREPYDFRGTTRTPRGVGGGGPTVFFANHLTLAAATGTWPSITPTSTTADVYFESGGALVLAKASAAIYNFWPDATDNSKRQALGSNNDGTYSVICQSCSAG